MPYRHDKAALEDRRVSLPLLESLTIASPCSADWAAMKGDDRVRFCGSCEKNVYNLSAMPRAEAEALLVEREGNVCVRFYRRQDGTVISGDCPVGVQKKRRRRLVLAVASAGAFAAAGAATFLSLHRPAAKPGCELSSDSTTSEVGEASPPPMMGAAVALAQPTAAVPTAAAIGSAAPKMVMGAPQPPPTVLMGAPPVRRPKATMGKPRSPDAME